jgi:hypothetical protein
MNLLSVSFRLAIVILVVVAGISVATACSCIGPATPCAANADADAIFVGTVERTWWETKSISVSDEPDAKKIRVGFPVTVFKVVEPFRGVKGGKVEVRGGGTNCDYRFATGKSYLVYSSSDDAGTFYSDICGRTQPLAKAREDLDYLHANRRTNGGTLQGKVSRESSDQVTFRSQQAPMRDLTVHLVSPDQRFQAVTDVEGNFKLANLPAGRYRIFTTPQTNDSNLGEYDDPPRSEWEIEITGFGCQTVWFSARPTGAITGRFSLSDGTSAKDESVELIPAGVAITDDNYWTRSLDQNGQFRFEFVPPGRYYLGMNLRSGASKDSPYPAVYYPGVLRMEDATVVELRAGQELMGYDLKLFPPVAERTIEGVARWPDGRPAANVMVQLDNSVSGYREGDPVTTDMKGKFSIQGMEGQTYNLSALIHDGQPLVNSVPLLVKVEVVNPPVELVIRLPNK